MPTMTAATSESSVMTSLSELARIERERVREEEAARARSCEELASAERRRAEEHRRSLERRVADELAAEAQREREAMESRVRAEARARAAHEVARIEAAAKVQLEADNALRAHELSVLRSRAEGRGARAAWMLGAALGLVCIGAATAAYEVNGHVASVERESDRIRQQQASSAREHESRNLAILAALDRRHAALRARAMGASLVEAGTRALAARTAIEGGAPPDAALDSFAGALDRLEATVYASERMAFLQQRELDLRAWATQERRSTSPQLRGLIDAHAAAEVGDDRAFHAYESALDRLRTELSKPDKASHARAAVAAASTLPDCRADDPICGVSQTPL